jgi:hypothetical protein
MNSRPCKPCLYRLSRIISSITIPSTSPVEAHLFMILTVSSLPTGSVIGDFLPTRHSIIQKQLGGKISGIHPKIPLMQVHTSGQGSRIRGMVKAPLPWSLLCYANTSATSATCVTTATTATNSKQRSQFVASKSVGKRVAYLSKRILHQDMRCPNHAAPTLLPLHHNPTTL